MLAFSIVVFALLLSAVSLSVIRYYVISDTIQFTGEAVAEHFAQISVFRSLFEGDGDGTGGAGESGESETHDHGGTEGSAAGSSSYSYTTPSNQSASVPGTGAPFDAEELEQTRRFVQMHFGVYNIETANFYNTSGTVFFSYDPAIVGTGVGDPWIHSYHDAREGRTTAQEPEGDRLHLWIPIHATASGNVVGVVEIVRNIAEINEKIRAMQTVMIVAVLAGMALLFFSLRTIFLSSARTIESKNRELQQLLGTIERTYEESLQTLSSALDLRDNETQGHSFRVTSYAFFLGQRMGLSRRELAELVRGALLHDVGKIGVPDRILLKPDRLTEEEWEVMRKHPEIGYNMLKHIEFLAPSLGVVLCHHERWDGSGYPNRLKGDRIPLAASIFAVCDTYDAITSDRPYRRGKGYAEAAAEIARCRGTQFHPAVVDAFLSIPEEQWRALSRLDGGESGGGRMALPWDGLAGGSRAAGA